MVIEDDFQLPSAVVSVSAGPAPAAASFAASVSSMATERSGNSDSEISRTPSISSANSNPLSQSALAPPPLAAVSDDDAKRRAAENRARALAKLAEKKVTLFFVCGVLSSFCLLLRARQPHSHLRFHYQARQTPRPCLRLAKMPFSQNHPRKK